MHSLLTIISFILLAGSLYLLFRSTCVADDAQRSLEGKNANSYPLYEEHDNKVVFYQRRKKYSSIFNFALIYIIFFTLANLLLLSITILFLSAAFVIIYAMLLYYHSFDRVEIDKHGNVLKYDFFHRNEPHSVDTTNGIFCKITHQYKIKQSVFSKQSVFYGDTYKYYSYFLCCKKEGSILLFEVESELNNKAEKLLTTILPKYSISNSCIINEHTDSAI